MRGGGPKAVLPAALFGVLLLASPVFGQLLARVEPTWSPFLTAPLVKGAPGAELIAEARRLFSSDPARTARVLASAPPAAGVPRRIAEGLRADALYALGGKEVLEAQRLYRLVITSDPSPPQEAWAEFMVGNIYKIQGVVREAEVAYRASLRLRSAAWRPAVLFDLGALELEAGRMAAARAALETWLRERGDGPAPGKALVLDLLAECLAAKGDREGALARWTEGRRLDPDAWLARPETGYAVADLFRRNGDVSGAVEILDAIPKARPGTQEGARARLAVGQLWEAAGKASLSVRSYARLLEEGAGPEDSRAARLRIALVGAEYGNRVRLIGQYEAYRIYYRPAPTLEEQAASKDPAAAQIAVRGLGLLARSEGRTMDALGLFARGFEHSSRSPEAMKAYDAFSDTLEAYVETTCRAGSYVDAVSAYDAMKGLLGWAKTRDLGKMECRVAEAYEALGLPGLAREVYEGLQKKGTRAISAADLQERILRARARDGDVDALRAWTARHPGDAPSEEMLARKLGDLGKLKEARQRYLKAASSASGPAERLEDLTEADRALDSEGRIKDLLAGLKRREALRQALPGGKERAAWERSAQLSEARLEFARGDFARAAKAFASLPELGATDTYLMALAERRCGRESHARELFAKLAKGADAAIASLASFHLEVAGVVDAARRAL